LKPTKKIDLMALRANKKAYIVGLCGGSASGKSSIGVWLKERFDVFIVDCDKLGHLAYADPTSECFQAIRQHFGETVVVKDEDGVEKIDRRQLGAAVFGVARKPGEINPELEKLNSIVWPAIERLAQREVEEYLKTVDWEKCASHPPIVILDAAVLLDANWVCDEVQIFLLVSNYNCDSCRLK